MIVDLSGFLTSITDLLGGSFEIDLAEMLGGDLLGGGLELEGLGGLLDGLGEMEMKILDSRAVQGEEGLYAVSLSLFPQ